MADRLRHVIIAVAAATVVVAVGQLASQPSAPTGVVTTGSGPSATPTLLGDVATTREASGSPARPTEGESGADEPPPASEIEPAAGTATLPGLPDIGREARRQRAARSELRRDFPELSSQEGRLAAAHPRRNVPVPSGADIRSSTVASDGDILQVGLVVRMPGTVDRAMRLYRIRLLRVGFTESSAPPNPAGDAAAFRRRPDTVVVVATRAGGGTVVVVHATLRTGG